MPSTFMLKIGHYEYHNVATLEIRPSAFPVCLLLLFVVEVVCGTCSLKTFSLDLWSSKNWTKISLEILKTKNFPVFSEVSLCMLVYAFNT